MNASTPLLLQKGLLCGLRSTQFLGGSDGKESACNGDPGSVPGWGRSPGEGNGYLLQYSCLENAMVRGTVHGVSKESDMTERLTLSLPP